MRLKEDPSDRDAFTVTELNLLFAASVFTKGERPTPGRGEAAFWLPLLSLYSGARRSELAGLRADDVQEVEHVPCFMFIEDKKIGKRLKTATAVRTVPIHPQLITLRWLQHVDAVRRRDALAGQKNSSVGRSYGAKQKSGAKDIVRRFGMPRLRDAVYGVNYEGLKLSKVKHVQH